MAIHASQYPIFPFIRVNFRYTDNAFELCMVFKCLDYGQY